MKIKSLTGLFILVIVQSVSCGVAMAEKSTHKSVKDDGIHVGKFLILPEIAIKETFDSNIFATRNNEVEDFITTILPSVNIKSTWLKHKVNFSVGGALSRYRENKTEDSNDYWANTSGRYDISKHTNIFGGLGYAKKHEDRSSPEQTLVGGTPTTYLSKSVHAGISHSTGKTDIRYGGTFERLDFNDVDTFNNDDRDRDITGVGFKVTSNFSRQSSVYLQSVFEKRAYDSLSDDNGYIRNSDGYNAVGGVKTRFSNRLTGDAYLGVLHQNYEDPRFATLNKLDFGGKLTWLLTPKTTISMNLDRTLEETTLPAASGYLFTSLSVNVDHYITSRLKFSANMLAGREKYIGVSRDDYASAGSLALNYTLSPRWYLLTGYQVSNRDSTHSTVVNNPANIQSPADYGRNQVFVTLGALLYPVKNKTISYSNSFNSLPKSDVPWPGFYIGAQVGDNAFHASNYGVRGGSGIDTTSYGDTGLSSGLFVGYVVKFNKWLLGIELAADNNRTDIYHKKDKPDSRALSIEKENSNALTARLGRTLNNGSLIYARIGAARSDFKTFFTVNNLPANAFSSTSSETGTRFGLGTDIPAGKHLFVRLDYSYTNYGTYVADVVTEAEELEPSESIFRVGLGWRFSALKDKNPSYKLVDYKGFYTGLQVGHGSVNSDVTGTHFDSGSGPFDFVGDFGSQEGVTSGIFVGYGGLHKHWYASVEAELDVSNAGWDHIRDPNGRNFSVEKKNTYGISLRGGYVLNNGTLLYARAGRVKTRFNTKWVKGGNRSNDIDRDDIELGTRVGVGAELPVNKSVFIRMDYTYTDYGSYEFTTSHANPDAMKFSNSETLFRLAVGSRF